MSAELFDTYLTPWMRYKLITWHKEYLTTLLAAKHLHDLTKTGEQKKTRWKHQLCKILASGKAATLIHVHHRGQYNECYHYGFTLFGNIFIVI